MSSVDPFTSVVVIVSAFLSSLADYLHLRFFLNFFYCVLCMGLLVGESDSKGNGFSREQNEMICVMTNCNLCIPFSCLFILGLGFDSFHLVAFLFSSCICCCFYRPAIFASLFNLDHDGSCILYLIFHIQCCLLSFLFLSLLFITEKTPGFSMTLID